MGTAEEGEKTKIFSRKKKKGKREKRKGGKKKRRQEFTCGEKVK